MPNATGRAIHVDKPLSNVLVSAFETEGDFVAQNLFPVVGVGNQSDKYYILQKESWLALANTYRAPKTKSRRIEFDVSSDAYYAKNYALAADNALEDLANADAAIRLRDSSTRMVAVGLMRDMENRVAALATTSGNHVAAPVTLTGADAWDAVNSADLAAQVHSGHMAIYDQTGLRANTLVLDYRSYMLAKRNTRLFETFKYRANGPLMVEDAQLKELFEVDNLWVARSQKNNANPAQTSSITSIWGPTALLCRVENALSMQTATYGMSFRWTSPELGQPMAVTRAREDGAGSRRVEVLEGGYYQDEKIVASNLAYYINTKSGNVW
jgi:hypothetical protein